MKKIIALILCLISAVTLFCACTPKDNVNSSSKVAEVESSVTESEDIKSETSSKKFSKNETSSIIDKENKSSKEEKESSKKQESEKESSKEEKPIDRNPSATSTSSGIKLNLPDIEGSTMELGCYQFSPRYTTNYTNRYNAINNGNDNYEANLREFEDVLSLGYFNTVFLEPGEFKNEAVWQVLEKYKMKVWLITGGIWTSKSKSTLDEYYGWIKTCDTVKNNPKRWEMFNGVAYDEIVHRGYSPEDFKTSTEYVYKVLGKRNFPVMAPQDFTTLWAIAGHGKQTTDSCKYFTDISFDMYEGDVRDNAEINFVVRDAQAAYPEYNIKDGKDVYRMMSSEMVKLVGHPVTVWYYPSAHAPGARHTEEFNLAQVKFFEQLLKEQEHPGGLILYTFAQGSETNFGFESFIDMGPYADKTIRRYEDQVMHKYSEYIKQLTMRYRLTQNNPVLDLGV